MNAVRIVLALAMLGLVAIVGSAAFLIVAGYVAAVREVLAW